MDEIKRKTIKDIDLLNLFIDSKKLEVPQVEKLNMHLKNLLKDIGQANTTWIRK